MSDARIPTAACTAGSADLWRAAGSSDWEATLTADHLVGANLAGHDSHGVGMIPRYVDAFLAGELPLNQTVSIASDGGTLLTVDAKHGIGSSVAFQAMEIAIERARQNGVCVIGLKNAHHIGRVGHWAEQAMASGSPPSTSPTRSPRRRWWRRTAVRRRASSPTRSRSAFPAAARPDPARLRHQRDRLRQGAGGVQPQGAGAARMPDRCEGPRHPTTRR